MEKNIDINIDYYTALNYFTTGNGVSTKNSWINVQKVDLPDAQDVVDASLIINPKQEWSFNISEESGTWWCLGSHVQDQPNGPDYCPTSLAQQNISWLFNYTYECTSRGCNNTEMNNGYWTKSEVYNNNLNAWFVNSYGTLRSRPKNNYEYDGVRPVITLFKANLAG